MRPFRPPAEGTRDKTQAAWRKERPPAGCGSESQTPPRARWFWGKHLWSRLHAAHSRAPYMSYTVPQQRLNFRPDLHEQGSFRPTFAKTRLAGSGRTRTVSISAAWTRSQRLRMFRRAACVLSRLFAFPPFRPSSRKCSRRSAFVISSIFVVFVISIYRLIT